MRVLVWLYPAHRLHQGVYPMRRWEPFEAQAGRGGGLVGIEVLAREPTPRPDRTRPYITHCVTCDGPAYALGGGSMWCLRCLRPFVAAGERFRSSIETRSAPA